MKNKEFPNLNDDTRPIFDEFAEIYHTEVLENGREAVKSICAEYNRAESQKLDNGNLPLDKQQIR